MTDAQIKADVPEKTGKRRRGGLALILLLVAAVAIVGAAFWLVGWWTHGRFVERTNNAYLQADTVVVSPKIGGYVTGVLVMDNQQVTAGQPLLRIDAAQYQAVLDTSAAEVAQRRADLVRFQADVARQEAARTEAVAQLAVAQAADRFATQEATRYQRLALSGADTTQRRDQTISNRDQTAGQSAAARAAVIIASREIDSLKAQVGQGQAVLGAAEARLRGARSNLDGVEITAPIAGAIGDRTVRVGQFVQPGTRLMNVVPLGGVYLLANFKETQIGRMRPGQRAEITLDALRGETIIGVVDSLAPGTGAEFALLPPENATGNFTKVVQRVPVRIRLSPRSARRFALRPGLSAEVAVDTNPAAARS